MASILGSQGVVLATAMAVSGTVILLALRLQKSLPSPTHQFPVVANIDPARSSPERSAAALRSCISAVGKQRSKNKKKQQKKRVHFAEDVVDPIGYSEEFRRQHEIIICKTPTCNDINHTADNYNYNYNSSSPVFSVSAASKKISGKGMPANRMALYNGILRDRLVHRLACSSY